MKLTGERDAWLEACQAGLRVVSTRASYPALAGLRIETSRNEVRMTAADLELSIETGIHVSIEEPGGVLVPGRLFTDVIRSLPSGKVSVEGLEDRVRVQGARGQFELRSLPVGDFPAVIAVQGERIGIEWSELSKAISQVIRGASSDEARPVLTGVHWELDGESLRLVATDSYRLAIRELVAKEGPGQGKALLPARALGELVRLIKGDEQVICTLGDRQASFEAGSVRLTTRLIEGEFPNYRQLLPSGYPFQLVCPKTDLTEAARRVGLLAQAGAPVRMELGDTVTLKAATPDIGEATEEMSGATYTGDPMTVAFNPNFLADGVDAIEGTQCVIEVSEPAKPAVVRGEDASSFVYLLMPVRLG